MEKILFIDIQTIKENSPIPLNQDEKGLRNSIWEAQEFELKDVIKEALYNDLKNKIKSGSLTDDDRLLLKDYIQPFLIYATLVQSLIPLSVKYNNKGLNNKTDNQSNNIDYNTFVQYKAHFQTKLDGYKRRLVDYLGSVESTKNSVNTRLDSTYNFLGFVIEDNYTDLEEYISNRANKFRYWRG